MTTYDLIVVGEGLGGLTCANRAAQAALKVATFEAEFFGGLVLNVNELDGYEESGGASGMDLASDLARANTKLGVASHQQAVNAIQETESGFRVNADGGSFDARAVVVASGARRRNLGVPGEAELHGKGVSHCADCDGPLFRGKAVVVVGGGDSAFQEALVLARVGAAVHVIHDGVRPKARAHFVEAVAAEPAIRVISEATVEAILGTTEVTGVRIRSTGGSTSELACTGIFVYIGLEPNGAFVPPAVSRDEEGYLVSGKDLESSVPNLWVIGQVRSGFGGLLREAVKEGNAAAEAVVARLD